MKKEGETEEVSEGKKRKKEISRQTVETKEGKKRKKKKVGKN